MNAFAAAAVASALIAFVGPGPITPPTVDGPPVAPNQVPVLESFTSSEIGLGGYVMEGQVTDDHPGDCLVVFGGALEGHSVRCGSDGSFSYTVELGPYQTGQVSAQAIDNAEQASNVMYDTILYRKVGSVR